jgi:hypothetical protein
VDEARLRRAESFAGGFGDPPRVPILKTAAVASGPGPRWLRRALVAAAVIYLAGLWLEAYGAGMQRVLPRPVLYFMQVARLFPNAVPMTTEYRVEAWSCEDRAWHELDERPYFPLHANDKESRFQRAMFFYHHAAPVMKALDAYLVDAANADAGRPPIGGVQLLSLRIPVPMPGQPFPRYQRKALDEYPPDYRKYWYRTPNAARTERCNQEIDRRGSPSP